MANADQFKRAAAARALDYVESGMRVGLGTGSTAVHFVELLAERVRDGLELVAVPTSTATKLLAERLGIPLTTLDEMPELDLTVDGADEIGPALTLIKGGGGALLFEKIVASASARMIVVADDTKRVAVLGAFPLPIEIVPFGLRATRDRIVAAARGLGLSGTVALRHTPQGATFLTDGHHYIFDVFFRAIPDPSALAHVLSAIPGVVEHGLFIGLATRCIVAGPTGIVEVS
jgi:ribose 5-phosphate isomerase A